MIATQLVVALGVSPRDGKARDHRTRCILVLVDREDGGTHAIEVDDALGQIHRRALAAVARDPLRLLLVRMRALVRVPSEVVRRSEARLLRIEGARRGGGGPVGMLVE